MADANFAPAAALPEGALLSQTFFPGAGLRVSPEDVRVTTSDGVLFFVHAMQLIQFSDHFFGEMLVAPHPLDPMQEITVTEPSTVFNVVLHAVYNLSCARYNPSDEDVMAAIHALRKYSVALNRVAVPATPLFALIVSRLGDRDVNKVLQFYALAGRYDLHDLAVHCSQYLLPLRAREIPPPLAEQMGVRYLKHLIFLRLDRVEKLREILSQPPQEHLPIPQCSSAQPAALARAWSLTGAYFMWEARADLTTVALELAFSKLADRLSCEMCRASLRQRLQEVLTEWSNVKRTI